MVAIGLGGGRELSGEQVAVGSRDLGAHAVVADVGEEPPLHEFDRHLVGDR